MIDWFACKMSFLLSPKKTTLLGFWKFIFPFESFPLNIPDIVLVDPTNHSATEIMSSADCSKLYKDESSPALPCSTCKDCKLLLQGTCGGALRGAGYPRKRSEALISCWATFSMTETNAASDQKGGGWVKDQLAINLKTQERQSNSIKKN